MSKHQFYRFSDYMEESFPFKIEYIKKLNCILHSHEHFQICYVLKGLCKHCVCDKITILSKGDIFAIPPNEEHLLSYINNSEVEIIQIDFMDFFINGNMRELISMESFNDFLYLHPLISVSNEIIPRLQMSSDNSEKIEVLIKSMFLELKAKEEGYQLSIKADLLKMLVIIGREFKNYVFKNKKYNDIRQYKNKFTEIINYIEKNYNLDFKLNDLAHMANMSPTYFSHMFKMVKGNTLIEFINHTRINKAMDFLTKSTSNITEVSLLVGFNNLSHFNKIFKRITGVNPSNYKKSKQNI